MIKITHQEQCSIIDATNISVWDRVSLGAFCIFDQKKITLIGGTDGNNFNFSQRISENYLQILPILHQLGYPYITGDVEWIEDNLWRHSPYIVGKTIEDIIAFQIASKRLPKQEYFQDEKMRGSLLDLPTTAVQAYSTKDELREGSNYVQFEEYIHMHHLDGFDQFVYSQQHWREEMLYSHKLNNMTQEYLPKTFQIIQKLLKLKVLNQGKI